LQLGEFGFEREKAGDLRFRGYADSWIRTTVPATCKKSTLHDYEDILKNHVLPVFGSLELPDITRGKIKDFLAHKTNEGYASSTVSHMKNVLSGILNKAVDDEAVPANPARGIGKTTKAKDRNEDMDPLTMEECKLLLDTARVHFAKDYPLFLLLARTGMRVGEALGLEWGDIDFNGRFINVQRGLSRKRIETPKNGRTRRVDMSLQLTEAMKAHRIKSKEKGLALGLGDAPQYVFTNEKGGFMDVNNWRRRVFNKALDKAGLRRIRIHDIRHTYATLRIAKGDNLADVSNQLGHHSVKLTMDIYYHWAPGKKKSEIDALDDSEYTLKGERKSEKGR
jgi:integrase